MEIEIEQLAAKYNRQRESRIPAYMIYLDGECEIRNLSQQEGL